MKLRAILILLASIIMGLVVANCNYNRLQSYQTKTVWEHYCKYNLHKFPENSTEEEYNYFLDCYSGGDEYDAIYAHYESTYPEYNLELKHYGKSK